MADDLARIYGPAQPTTSNTTLYTAPALERGAVIRHIRICNTTTTPAWISLGINGAPTTAANAFYYQFDIPASGIHDMTGAFVLLAGDTLQGLQETSGALTLTISGIEVS